MVVRVVNAQREAPVDAPALARVARCAIRRLPIRMKGTVAIACVSARRMRALNKRFCHHDRVTDVLSFRYHGGPANPPRWAQCMQVLGDIVIAPSQARAYAASHGLPYEEELARYVVHGLLHWLGHRDGTRAEQRRMRAMEDELLARCANYRADSTGLASRDTSIFARRKTRAKIEASR
jgi:probable rRNA maturation factor